MNFLFLNCAILVMNFWPFGHQSVTLSLMCRIPFLLLVADTRDALPLFLGGAQPVETPFPFLNTLPLSNANALEFLFVLLFGTLNVPISKNFYRILMRIFGA